MHNDSQSFVTALRGGAGIFDVKPGGSRRWVVKAGPATIEVLGTRFEVTHAPGAVTVRVERGTVLVRAITLPHGARRLEASESVEVREVAQSARRDEAVGSSSAPAPASARDATASQPSVSAPARSGPRTAVSATAAAGDAFEIDAWLARADAARQRGDNAAAIGYLEEIVRRAPPEDPRRGVAALSLARLTLDHDPSRAAAALGDSMASMPKGLTEDALARRVHAAALAGDREQAQQLAQEYLVRFPHGHRTEDIKRWLEP